MLTITKLQAGSRNNVIPRSAVLEGTVRTFSKEIMKYLLGRVQVIVKGIASAYRL